MRTTLLAVLAALLLSGCDTFYYEQNGYYESSHTPEWKYSLDGAICTFRTNNSAYAVYIITVSTTEHGEVYLHENIGVPKGSSFVIEDSNVTFRSNKSGIVKIPIQIEVATPEPDVFNVSPYPIRPTIRFAKELVKAGKIYEGITLENSKAVGMKKASRFVDVIAPLKIGDAESFTISLPRMQINGKELPKFEAEFRWNARTVHTMRQLQ